MSLLRRGDSGDEVRQIQTALASWGIANRDPPGSFGLWTEAAIYLLQHGENLGADGLVGPATAARLQDPTLPSCFTQVATPLSFIDGVPYYCQRDNQHLPDASCNVTALAMAMAFHGVTPTTHEDLADQLFDEISSPAGLDYFRTHCPDVYRQGFRPNTVFDMLAWAANQHGLDASFSQTRTLPEIFAEIDRRCPVVLSGAFTGSGHIVLLIGTTQAGDLICHDPWGDWMRGYNVPGGGSQSFGQGDARIYERDHAMKVLHGDSDHKWGLFIRP